MKIFSDLIFIDIPPGHQFWQQYSPVAGNDVSFWRNAGGD
jgi:hypothetical protein